MSDIKVGDEDIPPDIRKQIDQDRAHAEINRRRCSHLRIALTTAERAVQQAQDQMLELRLTDHDGLDGTDGLDGCEALASALSSLRNVGRIARLREIELET